MILKIVRCESQNSFCNIVNDFWYTFLSIIRKHINLCISFMLFQVEVSLVPLLTTPLQLIYFILSSNLFTLHYLLTINISLDWSYFLIPIFFLWFSFIHILPQNENRVLAILYTGNMAMHFFGNAININFGSKYIHIFLSVSILYMCNVFALFVTSLSYCSLLTLRLHLFLIIIMLVFTY